jgi:hypothetical protein
MSASHAVAHVCYVFWTSVVLLLYWCPPTRLPTDPSERVATQLSLLITNIARFDFPGRAPDLLQGLAAAAAWDPGSQTPPPPGVSNHWWMIYQTLPWEGMAVELMLRLP